MFDATPVQVGRVVACWDARECRVESTDHLPPGQYASNVFPRFGLGGFAFRFPSDVENIDITVGGEVGSPLSIHRELFESLHRRDQVSDFHCVTTWTKEAVRWSGVLFRDLYEQVILPASRPEPAASLVILRSQDGYSQTLPLEDLLAPDVLIADRLDETPLAVAHGAPVRLVAPAHYGYKNVKHLNAIEFRRDRSHYRFASFKFMDHPRARVALEERGLGVSPLVLRRIYPYLIRPVAWLFQAALDRHERLGR